MPSSLHVSLPDDMRSYVDLRTNGRHDFSTPSEYVRALIRADMEENATKSFVLNELLKSQEDLEIGQILDSAASNLKISALFDGDKKA